MASVGILLLVAILICALSSYCNRPEVKGRRSEKAVVKKLNSNFFPYDGKVISNVYIPKESGDTSEVDIIFVTQKGLFVFENKNYAGYIFGNEKSRNWTVTLYAGKGLLGGNKVEKHQFYNPVWQNKTHIKHLREYLGYESTVFSIISFSDRGDLMDISIESSNLYICNFSKIKSVVKKLWNVNPDVLTSTEIENIYNKLLPLTNKNRDEKRAHVEQIQKRFSGNICPSCNGKLVERVAKKGTNAGNKFLGCSNYPKCKYIQNM